EATGKNVAAVAVLDVISVSTRMPTAAKPTKTHTGTPAKPSTWVPSQSERPESENCDDNARPPPKSSSTPQGRFRAVSQLRRRTPCSAPPGMTNNATPTIIAIPEAEMTGSSSPKTYSEISGTATQEIAATMKTISTESSPTDIGPSLFHSLRMSSAPPGMFFVSGLNMTLVRMNHAPTINTMESGTPTSIHRPKPNSMSWA